MKCDILLKNGHVYDPGTGIDYIGDLAVKDGRIISPEGMTEAKRMVDVTGMLVIPGLIDVHNHLNWKGGHVGMPVDVASIPNGTTAAIDAGSTGVSNAPMLIENLSRNILRSKIMLNVSACGIIMAMQFAEPVDPDLWDKDLFRDIFRLYGDRIMGLKLRISKPVVGDMGLRPLEKACELAEELGTRVIVHTTNPPASMSEVADVLRKGDVLTHMYHGAGHTCLENGRVCDGYYRARERGVLFDAAPGQGNFAIEVAKEVIAQGFLPDTISTDLARQNWNNERVYSLPAVMSKFMALGMSLEQVIRCTTTEAAKQFGEPEELGTLKLGTAADITVLEDRACAPLFQDKYGSQLTGERMLIPHMTIIGGRVFYQSTMLHPGMR